MSKISRKLLLFPRYVYFAAKSLYEDHERKTRELANRDRLLDGVTDLILLQRYKESRNNFQSFGSSSFSQGDEDGLTMEIIKRIGLKQGTFLEFGIGDGRENNTLILRSLGFKGAWVDALDNNHLRDIGSKEFYYQQEWIHETNVLEIMENFRQVFESVPQIVSMDLDGNDYWIWKIILEAGYRPEIAIAEYNARFPLPIDWKMPYNKEHNWLEDDYYGASLQALINLFSKFEYFPLVCSINGTNVFFVKTSYLDRFPERSETADIFLGPFYTFKGYNGHRVSLKTVRSILQGDTVTF
jgi:hypothetical protein